MPARDAEKIGLPPRVFLYTLDQLSVMLDIPIISLKTHYLFLEGRSIGSRNRGLMTARNIAQTNEHPDWRVSDREFVRWMKVRGFRYYDRGVISG